MPAATVAECNPLEPKVTNVFSPCKTKMPTKTQDLLLACNYDTTHDAKNAQERRAVACNSFQAFVHECMDSFNMNADGWRNDFNCRMY